MNPSVKMNLWPFAAKTKTSKSGSSTWDSSPKINCSSTIKFMIWLIQMLMIKFKGILRKLIQILIDLREGSKIKSRKNKILRKMMIKVINLFLKVQSPASPYPPKVKKRSHGRLTCKKKNTVWTKNQNKTQTPPPKHSPWNTFSVTEVTTAATT